MLLPSEVKLMDKLERDVQVQRYFPDVVANAKEFKQLANIENDEFKLIWQIACKSFYNTFVYSADLQGIKRWEQMLKIIPKNTESIEDRRTNILVKINSMLPYTIRRLKQILHLKYGTDNAIPVINEYELLIKFNPEILLNANLLRALLRSIIPANLIYKVLLSFSMQIKTQHKANSEQYINAVGNFWNLGTAESTHWDGIYLFDANIDFSGIKPDSKYKDRQMHILEFLFYINAKQELNTSNILDFMAIATSKHKVKTQHSFKFICNVDLKEKQNINYLPVVLVKNFT